ncbi:MAG: MBL fold metallo-hydrolase [Pseudomonadota bacterium]
MLTSLLLSLLLLGLLFMVLPGCAGARFALTEQGLDLGHRAAMAWQRPERLQVPHGAEAHRVNGPLVYVVPVNGGVVLVDTGYQHSGEQIRTLVGQRRLLAILITHNHLDHVAGVETLGVPVYAGSIEARRWREHAPARALVVRIAERVLGQAAPPAELHDVDDGTSIEIGGARFTAHLVPGHTPGSTTWLWRDVLFSGDAAVSLDNEKVRPPFAVYTDRPAQCWTSLKRLLDVEFSTICDGHYGCTLDAKEKLRRSLSQASRS